MVAKVVLIGGAPGAGKTTLGRALAAELGYASMTIDDLMVAIRALTTPESHPAFHVMPYGHLRYFTDGPAEKLIDDARSLEHAIWPAIERLIRSRQSRDHGIVIDWWLLPPNEVAALASDQVRSIWLHIAPDELERRELATADFRNGSDHPERMHQNFMARSLWRNQHIAEQAVELGLPLLRQTGHISRNGLVDQALRMLT